MERRTELFAFFGIALILFIASVAFYSSKTIRANSPIQQTQLEECNTLIYNGDGKINFVFFSTKEQAEEYTSYFLDTYPFNENPLAFNFFYITPEQYQPKCEIYKGAAVFCYSYSLIKKSASCPNDYIVVLDNRQASIRSSAYLNIMSLNSRHSLNVLIHEFGHVFANLAEEYAPAKIPRGSQNCQASCESFSGKVDGCFQECSKSSYYRTIENGVMRTLSTSNYGTFNSNLIQNFVEEKISGSKITGAASDEEISCENKKYFLIEAQIKDGKINIIDKEIQQGCSPSESGLSSDLTYRIYAENGEVIFENEVNLNIFTDGQEESEAEITGETFSQEGQVFFITAPYTGQESEIEIINANTGESITENLQGLQNFGEDTACHL